MHSRRLIAWRAVPSLGPRTRPAHYRDGSAHRPLDRTGLSHAVLELDDARGPSQQHVIPPCMARPTPPAWICAYRHVAHRAQGAGEREARKSTPAIQRSTVRDARASNPFTGSAHDTPRRPHSSPRARSRTNEQTTDRRRGRSRPAGGRGAKRTRCPLGAQNARRPRARHASQNRASKGSALQLSSRHPAPHLGVAARCSSEGGSRSTYVRTPTGPHTQCTRGPAPSVRAAPHLPQPELP